MNDLKSILTVLLLDTIKAQHDANVYSASLAEKYYQDDKNGHKSNLSYFNTPNSCLKELEVDLKLNPIEIISQIPGNIQSICKHYLDLIMNDFRESTGENEQNSLNNIQAFLSKKIYVEVFKLMEEPEKDINKLCDIIFEKMFKKVSESLNENKGKNTKNKTSNPKKAIHKYFFKYEGVWKKIIENNLKSLFKELLNEQHLYNKLIINPKISSTVDGEESWWNLNLKIDLRELSWMDGQNSEKGNKSNKRYLLAT